MELRNRGGNTQFKCTIESGRGIADSSSDDDATLKQLRKRLFTKKRKCIAEQEDKKAVEDESDLDELLINLKQKHSKVSKYKRKRVKLSVFYSSTVDFPIKSEENLVSIGCPEVICDEVKIPEEGLNPDKTSTSELKSMVLCDYREPIICAQQYKFCSDNPSKISYDHVLCSEPISILAPSDRMGVDLELPEVKSEEILDVAPLPIQMANGITDANNSSSFTMKNIYSPCNQISDMEFDSIDGGCGLPKEINPVLLEDRTEADSHREVEDSPSSLDKNCGSYQNSIIFVKIEENVVSTEDIASKMEFSSVPLEDKTEANFPNEVDDSPSSPDKNQDSYTDSIISSKIELDVASTEDTMDGEDQSSTCSNVTERDGLNWEGRIEGELLKAEEKQNKALPITDEESQPSLENHTRDVAESQRSLENHTHDVAESQPSLENHTHVAESQPSLENHTHDVADTIPTSGPHLSPENILSTRKAISPSSQEQLCVAMNSAETWNDVDKNKCKENHSDKQTTMKASSLRSENQLDKANINHRRPDKVRQRKIIITPPHNCNIKKSQIPKGNLEGLIITPPHNCNIKKSQIPKGNLEGPRFSRALPNLNSDCTSIQSCSERAIEFSKQQMHDMESLALKLMNELKSMKDIVEQKLLFEAYRNAPLKNDPDEIKSAINSAVKVEETSRRWLSIMSRDCNRFCKIMKLTPNAPAPSNSNTPLRKGRKIVFADEAGGDLCHIKIFEDDDVITSSPVSDGVKDKDAI